MDSQLYVLERLKEIVDDKNSGSSYDSQEIVSDTTSFGSVEDTNSGTNYDNKMGIVNKKSDYFLWKARDDMRMSRK